MEKNSQTDQNFSSIKLNCLVNHRSARVAAQSMFDLMAPLQACQRHIGAVPVIRLFIHSGLHTVRPGSGNVGTGDDGLSERKPEISSDDEVT